MRAELRREIGASQAEAQEAGALLAAQDGERGGLQRECDRLTQLLRAERAASAQARAEGEAAARALEASGEAEEQLRAAMQAGRGELVQAQLASRRAESDAALLRRQLLDLELCQKQLGEAQAACEEARGGGRVARAQTEATEQANGRAEATLAAQQAERDELAASHKAVCAERDGLLVASASLERQLASARLSGEEAADAKEGAIGRLGRAEAELASARETARSLQRDAESAANAKARAEAAQADAEQAPGFARDDARTLSARARCRRAPRGWPGRPSGRAPRSTRRARRRCGRRRRAALEPAQSAVEAALAEARAAREVQHAAALEACGLQTSAEAAQAVAANREDEVAQLKTLVSRLDAAREELGAKLRAAQRALQDQDAEAEAHAEGREAAARLVAERDATVAQLRHVLGSVSHTSQNPSILPSCHVHGTV